jgi:hypothetical protein
MFCRPKLVPGTKLLVALVAATVFAACDGATTAPDSKPRERSLKEPRRDIEGDTLSCRGGWVIIGGYYVCT